jgi:uncharacterized protein YecE (DUF72 family)
MALFVGTSGWAYKQWKPDFYPEKLPQKKFLEHYGTQLGAVEINATFYRGQSPETLTRWAADTPNDFSFAVKAHRALTYMKKFAPEGERGEFYTDFLKSLSPLGHKLGVVFMQFPKHRDRDEEQLQTLLDFLPDDRRYAFEFVNEDWRGEDIENALARIGTMVYVDRAGDPPETLPPGPLGYVRLRVERYDDAQRQAWADLLRREGAERDVYAFIKHEEGSAGDPYGGVGLARWLQENAVGG